MLATLRKIANGEPLSAVGFAVPTVAVEEGSAAATRAGGVRGRGGRGDRGRRQGGGPGGRGREGAQLQDQGGEDLPQLRGEAVGRVGVVAGGEALEEAAGGAEGVGEEIAVEASTVGEVVRALDGLAPGIGYYICDERGRLRAHVNIFVGKAAVANNLPPIYSVRFA